MVPHPNAAHRPPDGAGRCRPVRGCGICVGACPSTPFRGVAETLVTRIGNAQWQPIDASAPTLVALTIAAPGPHRRVRLRLRARVDSTLATTSRPSAWSGTLPPSFIEYALRCGCRRCSSPAAAKAAASSASASAGAPAPRRRARAICAPRCRERIATAWGDAGDKPPCGCLDPIARAPAWRRATSNRRPPMDELRPSHRRLDRPGLPVACSRWPSACSRTGRPTATWAKTRRLITLKFHPHRPAGIRVPAAPLRNSPTAANIRSPLCCARRLTSSSSGSTSTASQAAPLTAKPSGLSKGRRGFHVPSAVAELPAAPRRRPHERRRAPKASAM